MDAHCESVRKLSNQRIHAVLRGRPALRGRIVKRPQIDRQ